MRSSILSCVVLLLVSQAMAQQQVEREIPLKYADATQIAAMFAVQAQDATARPPQSVCLSGLNDFVSRCVAAAARDVRYDAGAWQAYLEVGPAPTGPMDQVEGTLGTLLPPGVSKPKALPAKNALLVAGSAEGIDRFQEILNLLDRPVKRVELQIELLHGTANLLDKLQVGNWSREAGRENDPTVTRWKMSTIADLQQRIDDAGSPPRLTATTITRNNSAIELHVGETLQRRYVATADEVAAVRVAGHFIALGLTPRLNADDSVTMLVEAFSVVGETKPGDTTRLAPQVSRVLLRTQIRAGKGETVAIHGLYLAGADGQPVGDDSLLACPAFLITPRLLEGS